MNKRDEEPGKALPVQGALMRKVQPGWKLPCLHQASGMEKFILMIRLNRIHNKMTLLVILGADHPLSDSGLNHTLRLTAFAQSSAVHCCPRHRMNGLPRKKTVTGYMASGSGRIRTSLASIFREMCRSLVMGQGSSSPHFIPTERDLEKLSR